jgi:tetratricopeptide (TPR) repeat protein
MPDSFARGSSWLAGLCFVLLFTVGARAQDPSIEKLLSKLPPPEKLVKPRVDDALRGSDPALRDPITTGIVAAARTGNRGRAAELSRQLTHRYPRSASAFCVRGAVALALRQYSEAGGAFRTAVDLQPNLSFAHLGRAQVEGAQGRFAAAIPHLQRFVRLEPKKMAGWFALSDCAQRLGRKGEAVEYARRGTAAEPSAAVAWMQLARAENVAGTPEEHCARSSARPSFPPIAARCWRWWALLTST